MKASTELRRRYVWLAVANVSEGREVWVAVGSRVGVDLAPSNPAGSIPRHPMARRAKALAVIRADPNTRDLSLSSGNGSARGFVVPRTLQPLVAAASASLARPSVSFFFELFVQSFQSLFSLSLSLSFVTLPHIEGFS